MTDMHTVHDWLKRFYHHILMHTNVGEDAKEYLLKRGITEGSMKEYNLGYAPKNTSLTLDFLKSKKISIGDSIAGNVLYRYKNGQVTDRFRDRITFPIYDYQDRVSGFGGRAMYEKAKAKYINSPETDIYQKSYNLYGLNLARKTIQDKEYVIVFEGYFDAIKAYQSGIKNSVATLGTALTKEQAFLIKSITPNAVICFDGDQAGMESSFKSATVLENTGCNVKIAHIKNGLDPDDYITKHSGRSFVDEVIKPSKVFLDSFIDYKKTHHNLNTTDGRYSYAHDVLSELTTYDSKQREKLFKELGSTLSINTENIEKVIKERGSM